MASGILTAFLDAQGNRLLLAIAVVVAAAWLGGRIAEHLGQPGTIGEILAGIVLGPSLLGASWPDAMVWVFPPPVVGALGSIAQLGLVLFMFLVGLEVEPSQLRGHGRRASVISLSSIVVPVVLGIALSPMLQALVADDAEQPGFGLFIGAAMGITAFPVLARLLQQLEVDRSPVGVLAIACAAIDDVTAWCLLAATVALVTASGWGDLVLTIGAASMVVVLVLFLLRPLLRRLDPVPLPVAVALALAVAWLTDAVGVHAVFGAFLVGLAVPRETGRAGRIARDLEVATTRVLLPVFFVVVGLSVQLSDLGSTPALVSTAAILVVAVVGKLGGASIAARATGMSWADATGLGLLMNTRGLTEIVILTVGLELGVIDEVLYSALVVMALVTTCMAVPLLRATGAVQRWRSAVDSAAGIGGPLSERPRSAPASPPSGGGPG